jgi:hypothetical protein
LRENDPLVPNDPKYMLRMGYNFACRNGTHSPAMNEAVAMAKRYWAMLRLTGCPTVVPTIECEPEFEQQIAHELARLPNQKWSRHSKAIGLELPRGKPGPKPSAAGLHPRAIRRTRRKER